MQNRRFFVQATEEQIERSGVDSGTPVEYHPDTREIVALDDPDGMNCWIVYADSNWISRVKNSSKFKVVEVSDNDFDDILENSVILTVECASKIFTDKMQFNFTESMLNIIYGTHQPDNLH